MTTATETEPKQSEESAQPSAGESGDVPKGGGA